jgi:hypothetical protein
MVLLVMRVVSWWSFLDDYAGMTFMMGRIGQIY